MSDLVERLRHSKGWPTLGNAAADRITELEAQRDELLEALGSVVDEYECQIHGPIMRSINQARAAIAKCEAKP